MFLFFIILNILAFFLNKRHRKSIVQQIALWLGKLLAMLNFCSEFYCWPLNEYNTNTKT